MYNSETPLRAELPSSRQLVRSTLVALVSAAILLVAVVMPADYGIDPTGVGRILGLTEMGQIKMRLAKEAEEDALGTQGSRPSQAVAVVPSASDAVPSLAATDAPGQWRNEMTIALKPGEGTEVKMRMKEGERALFSWTVQGGVVNFDTHGDSFGRSVSYEKGRGVSSEEGALVAAFTGNHGWFWRNRGEADVTLVLRTGGQYADITRVK